MLLYPLQGKVLGWLLLMSGAALLFHAVGEVNPWLAMLLGALWWLMAFRLASQALTGAASGREGDGGYASGIGDGVAARQVALGVGLFVLVWLLGWFAGPGAQLAACMGMALLLPAMVIVLVMEDSLLRALDPTAWYELLRRVGSSYLVLAAKLTAMAAAVALAFVFLFAPLPAWLATTMLHFLALYALLAGYHALGALLLRHRDALELRVREPLVSVHVPTGDEELALAECDRLVAAQRADEGAAVLERLIRERGASAAVHARYRELLAGLGDNQGLLRHAHDYVSVLLGQGKEREAMALYLGSRAMYGQFELEEPQKLSALIGVAARQQQAPLAMGLAEELARRFPDFPRSPELDAALAQLAANAPGAEAKLG